MPADKQPDGMHALRSSVQFMHNFVYTKFRRHGRQTFWNPFGLCCISLSEFQYFVFLGILRSVTAADIEQDIDLAFR